MSTQKETPTPGGNQAAGVNTHSTNIIVPDISIRSNAFPTLQTLHDGAVLAVNLFEELGEPLQREARILFIQSALVAIAKSADVEKVSEGFASVVESWLKPVPRHYFNRYPIQKT